MAHRFRLTCVPGLLTFLVFAATDTSGAIVVGTKITVTNPEPMELTLFSQARMGTLCSLTRTRLHPGRVDGARAKTHFS